MNHDATTLSAAARSARRPSLWRRCRRWVLPLVAVVVFGLLLSHAHKVDWAGAWEALQRYPATLLLGVLGVATASHALYGCYDLIGRRHIRHRVPAWRTWAIAVTSYAFNLNLGSLVGGIALRARLYARAGLDEASVAQVVGVSLATNWLGYGLLAGGLFAAGIISPPRQASIGAGALRGLGVVMILLAAAYVVACAFSRGRQWQLRGRKLRLPSAKLALIQLTLLISVKAHWAIVVNQRNPILLQPEVERHRIGLAVGDDLRVEDDDDVRERDLADLIDRFIRDPHIALYRCHALFRSIERDNGAFPTGVDDGGAQNVRAGDDSLAADACHSNVKAFRHGAASLILA